MSGQAKLVRPAQSPRTASDSEIAQERRHALRVLLASPLLLSERTGADDWFAVKRNIGWLRDWFADQTGWNLTFDARIGVARLRKQVGWANADATRGAVLPSTTKTRRRAFSRRAYVLFCLACAELDRTAGAQTLVSTLAQEIGIRSATEGLDPFEHTEYHERMALVDALHLLESFGILALTDGDTDHFLSDTGDALYTINRDRLGRLVATPRVPSAVGNVAELVAETYPEGDEGRIRRTRHELMRRLLDDPVVYDFELDERTRTYLRTQRSFLAARLREAGLDLERRDEGAAAIDRNEELTDQDFPGSGTLAHASLLFCEFLTVRAREGKGAAEIVSDEELVAFARVLLEQQGARWSDEVQRRGASLLVEDVLAHLVAFRIARRVPGGISPLPVAGRLRSTEVNALADACNQLALDLGDKTDVR